MKTVFLSFSILLLIACNPKVAENTKNTENETTITPAEITADSVVAEIKTDTIVETIVTEEPDDDEERIEVILTFKKTQCFGKCPAFVVELLSDGRIFYDGRANVEKLGKHESMVNDSFIYTVFQEADKIDFYNLSDSYPTDDTVIPDLPRTITFLKNGKKEHQIVNSFGSPLELQKFEEFLWKKIEELYWTKIGPED